MSETCIVKCPSCENPLEFPREIAGHVTDCPVCGGKIKLEVFVEEVPKVSFFQRIIERIRSFRKPAPPAEPIPDLDSPEGLQEEVLRLRQKVHNLEEETKTSKSSPFLTIVGVLLAYVVSFVILGVFVIQPLRTFYVENYGPGENLPEITLLVFSIYYTVKHNFVALIILFLPICFALVWFTRSKESSLSRDIRKLIYSVSKWGLVLLWLVGFIAIFLCFLENYEKTGQWSF